jgi:hypothetical protein
VSPTVGFAPSSSCPYSPKCVEGKSRDVRSAVSRIRVPFAYLGDSRPFETPHARADTVGLPAVASGNRAPCGI